MDMDESSLHRSYPETPVAIPEQSVSIDIAVREQSIRMDWAANRIRFDLVAGKLHESCAVQGN